MSSYHFSMQIISRGDGRSAIAAAAYRAGERLVCERSGQVADYRGRRGVVHAEILAPGGSAPWLQDRAQLWNAVEGLEKRRDAQLAREINLALPAELSATDRLALVRAFVREHFVARGMVADLAVHAPVPEKGDDPRNHHAHILLTLRQGSLQGLSVTKTRAWNSRDALKYWRASWAAAQNHALARTRSASRVDHRSLAVQQREASGRGDTLAAVLLDRQPEIHMGPRALHGAHVVPALQDPQATLRRPAARLSERLPDLARGNISNTAPWRSPGPRVARNLAHLQANASRQTRRTAHWQARAALARTTFHLRQRRVLRASSLRPPLTQSYLNTHRRKQLRLAQLIRNLDRLLRGLMLFRELRLQRRLILLRRIGRGRTHAHDRGRRRVRRC